jgi:hypothetical protein
MDPRLAALLDEIEEFLDGQQDVVDGDDGVPQPNRAMLLLATLTEVRALVSA